MFNLDETLQHWSEIRDNLAHYLIEVNNGRHGEVAPKTTGIHSIYRRYLQTSLFSELGIASKSTYSIGMVLNPVVGGKLTRYAIPVALSQKGKKPDVRYTSFDYEAWGQSHDQLVEGLTPNPVMLPKQMIGHDFRFPSGVVFERMSQQTEEFSERLNGLMLTNLRKYVTSAGPHFFNMPLLQASLLDAGLSEDVYHRYTMTCNGVLVGYFVAEVTDSMFTITHCLVNSEWMTIRHVSLANTLMCVLRKMMNEDSSLRFKILHRSKLLDRHMLRIKS